MSLRSAFLLVLVGALLTGCHVAEHARQCSRLATTLKETSDRLNAAPLPPHPKPEALLTAAVLYGDLEKALRKTELSDPKLKAERDKLAQGLSTIQEKLQEAATAVSAYGAAGKSATGPALSAEELAYARAKRGVESASRFLSGVITRLESVCRK